MKINNKINNIIKGLCATLVILTVTLGIQANDYLGSEGTRMLSVAEIDPDYIKHSADDETAETALLALPLAPLADTLNFVYSRKGNGRETIKLYNTETLARHSYIADLGYLMEYLGINKKNEAYYDVRLQGGMYAIKKEDVSRFLPASEIKSFPYYENAGGKVVHHVEGQPWNDDSWYMTSTLGHAPAWMQPGKRYYSFSGIYFTDSIAKLGQYDERTNAVNGQQPYYDYYLYLPARTKTNLTAQQLDDAFNTLVGNETTKMTNTGASFIKAQNKYGVNALLMFAMGIHESNHGRSNFAVNRNNLFGVNAVDNDPSNATYFDSVEIGIQEQGNDLSWVHADPNEQNGSNYYGSNLGTKSSGMNVTYASDPYWGEKIAHHYATIDRMTGSSDYEKYNIGMATQGAAVYWDETATTGAHTYKRSTSSLTYMYPIVYYTSMTMNGSELLKITLEPPYRDDRTVNKTRDDGGIFSWFYGYVHAGHVLIFNEAQKELPKDEDKNDDSQGSTGDTKDEENDSSVQPDPTTPIEPEQPAVPSTPIEPAQPIIPGEKIEPADPNSPGQPIDPSDPVEKDSVIEEKVKSDSDAGSVSKQNPAEAVSQPQSVSSSAPQNIDTNNDGLETRGAEFPLTGVEMDVTAPREKVSARVTTNGKMLAKAGGQTWEYVLFGVLLFVESIVLFAIAYLKFKLHSGVQEI